MFILSDKNMNKILLILFFIGNILNTTIIRGQNTCPLIPYPQSSSRINETFQLSSRCVIVYTEEFESQAYLLQKELLRYTSIAVSTLPDKATLDSNIVYNVIKLKKDYKFKSHQRHNYYCWTTKRNDKWCHVFSSINQIIHVTKHPCTYRMLGNRGQPFICLERFYVR